MRIYTKNLQLNDYSYEKNNEEEKLASSNKKDTRDSLNSKIKDSTEKSKIVIKK